MDLISDDDLVDFMKDAYDGVCQGSLELLSDRELYGLARNLRFGEPSDWQEDPEELDPDEEVPDE